MAILYVQDPEEGGPTTLETLVGLADGATGALGLFAFASVQGIDMLFDAAPVQTLAEEGSLEILVGISAITDRRALERLSELEAAFRGFRARVFWDRVHERLFHPKLCVFEYQTDDRAVLVGSGNLTPGGLRHNYEAFAVQQTAVGDVVHTAELEEFLARNPHNLHAVDDPHVLARAALNVRMARRGAGGPGRAGEEADVVVVPEGDGDEAEQVLVCYAPKGRGGWAQLQLNLDVWAQFFHIPAVAGEPLTLQQRRLDGGLGAVENRILVYPENTNQNIRIELAAARGRGYPPAGAGRPIVLFRDQDDRHFEYIALEPGDDGHGELALMLEAAPDSIGRGSIRVVRPLAALRLIWPDCPW
jgi:hypothetical protein